MPMKVGMADSGKATAAMNVARQSRRNSQTTRTASAAPSYSRAMDAWNSSSTGLTKLKASVKTRSGEARCKSARAACTAAPISTSLAPRLRVISNPTTGWPFSSARMRGSATVSLTRAI